MLRRVAAAIVLAIAMAACESASPSTPSGPPVQPVVAASWVADDGSLMALNVVLPPTIRPGELTTLAEGYRDERPGARVIVRFFPSTAGHERFVVAHVPMDGGDLPPSAGPHVALATFDFPAPTSRPTGDAP